MNNPFTGTVNVKDNVVFHPLTFTRPEMIRILLVAKITSAPAYNPTITSGVEGRHSSDPWSKHYTGWALDFRINDLAKSDVTRWVEQLKVKLGAGYFVLLESNHIHIHYIKGLSL